MRVASALTKASAAAAESSAEDSSTQRPEFKLQITEDTPTTDQLMTILDYVGTDRIPSIVKGAHDKNEALRKFKENSENFQWPVVCTNPSLSVFSHSACRAAD